MKRLFHQRLKYVVEIRGYADRLPELAQRTMIHTAALRHYTTVSSKPTVGQLVRLCKHLHCSSDYLLGLSEAINVDPEIETHVVRFPDRREFTILPHESARHLVHRLLNKNHKYLELRREEW